MPPILRTSRSVRVSAPLALLGAFLLSGCAYARKVASPASTGYSVNLMPGMQLGESRASAHALVGYTRVRDPGGFSHTRLVQFGGQARYAFMTEALNGPWAGAEAAYLRVTSIPKGADDRPSASGYSFGLLAGYRFKVDDRLPPISPYLSISRFHRGEFSFGGSTPSGPGLDGTLYKLGVDVHLASMFHARGR